MFPQYSALNIVSFLFSFLLMSFSFIYVALGMVMLTSMIDHMIFKIIKDIKMNDFGVKKNIYIYRKIQKAFNYPMLGFMSSGYKTLKIVSVEIST